MVDAVTITRNIHGSVLIEMGRHKVLTDLFFKDYWFARMHEKRGLEAAKLPRLSAIIGCHGVFDHWHPKSMKAYRWKGETPVFCASPAMVKSAKKAGFAKARVVQWGENVVLDGLTIETLEAQYITGMKVNNYVLQVGNRRVFFGSETRDIGPLIRYRESHAPVELAILPIDGSTFLGQRFVMLPHEAFNATRILGAVHMVPVHYSLKSIPPIFQTPANLNDLEFEAEQAPDIKVSVLPTGERREFVQIEHLPVECE